MIMKRCLLNDFVILHLFESIITFIYDSYILYCFIQLLYLSLYTFMTLFLKIMFTKVHVAFSDDNKIIVEGPTNMIPKVIESLKKGIECYVSTELVVDPKFFKHIIGKNGSNSK